ncbi:MAG: TolC family protein [Bacteroidia bacterium]
MTKHFLVYIIVFIFCSGIHAQYPPAKQDNTGIFTLDSAISITLKSNYNILLAQNAYKASENNYAPGMAGMLPEITLNTTYTASVSSIDQQYSSGLEVNRGGAVTTNISPYLGMSWTLFDGTRMFVAYNQLGLLKDEGILNLKAAIQDNIASVIETYYNIVQQKQLLAVDDSNLVVYKEEMEIARKQYEVGTGSKLNYLQAEVSYNAQNSAYLKQQVEVLNAIIALNQLLKLPVETIYNVRDDINIGKELNYDSLSKSAAAQNPSLALAKTGIRVAEYNVKEANALRLPVLNLGVDYGLTRTQSNAGFALLNQANGLLSGGFTLSWNIFNGSIINIQHENAKLAELSAEFQYGLTSIQVNATLLETFKQYEVNLKILEMDEDNYTIAKENVNVALEQFKIGTTNIIQLQQAQASYAQAGSQVVSDRYMAKISETELLQLAGQIAK